eukprot:COSAG06_NODE_63598_length_262_cov_0.515337_1_plen_27_part_10
MHISNHMTNTVHLVHSNRTTILAVAIS